MLCKNSTQASGVDPTLFHLKFRRFRDHDTANPNRMANTIHGAELPIGCVLALLDTCLTGPKKAIQLILGKGVTCCTLRIHHRRGMAFSGLPLARLHDQTGNNPPHKIMLTSERPEWSRQSPLGSGTRGGRAEETFAEYGSRRRRPSCLGIN
jgi:hypothetical protein